MKKFIKKHDVLYRPLQLIWIRYNKLKALLESIKFNFVGHKRNESFKDIDAGLLTLTANAIGCSYEQYDKALKSIPDNVRDQLIMQAGIFVDKKIKIFGRNISYDGTEIEWSRDAGSGYRWPIKYYKRLYPIFNTHDITDGKFPYELSRFNHAPTLAIAYRLTGNEKYAAALVDQMDSWLKSNPYPCSINWTCTMDVAIRLCNWIMGYLLIRDSSSLTNDFIKQLSISVCEHILYIIENPEREGNFTTNHYIADIAGLILPAVIFPKIEEKFNISDHSLEEYKKAMEHQVYPDGCDFEASTCYHRLVLEFFFFITYILVACNDEFDCNNHRQVAENIFGEEYIAKLYDMFDTVKHLLKPNSKMPQIGDNDSGRFIGLYPDKGLDLRYLLSLGAVFFKESRWKIREFFTHPDDLTEISVLYGTKGMEIWNRLETNSVENVSSKAFAHSGWYVMRHKKNYAIITCGPNGQNGRGGHCHSDKLSFELCVNGTDMIVDPGTYTYTAKPKWRNKFRSTAYHNTVVVDKQEACTFKDREIWLMPETVNPNVLKWEDTEEYSFFDGEHYGYQQLKDPVTHRRKIYYEKEPGYWIIKDILTAESSHMYELYFHFAPMKVGPLRTDTDLTILSSLDNPMLDNDSRINISLAMQTMDQGGTNIMIIPVDYDDAKMKIETGFYSTGYGCKTEAPVVKYTKHQTGPVELTTVIYPVQ